ncbi:hypothetical protein IGI46_002252 [Enterococcus sp. AZ163]
MLDGRVKAYESEHSDLFFRDYDDHSMAKYFGFYLREIVIEEILDAAFKSRN